MQDILTDLTSLPVPMILWRDGIQENLVTCGFESAGTGVARSGGPPVLSSDANGANLSRVFIDGEYALRHLALLDITGARSQVGISSTENVRFARQSQSPEGIYVAHECKLPTVLSADGDGYAWMNLWDFHSCDMNGSNRWHTSPGLMLAQDGSMRVRFEWGGPANAINPPSPYSTVPLPVRRWFDMEMHYVWSLNPTTINLWIDGQLALEQSGIITRAATHTRTETYFKLYGGSQQGHAIWTPNPIVRYTRNVRIAGGRIWR